MAYEYKYSSDSTVITKFFKGTIYFEELFEAWEELIHENKLDLPVTGILNDFTYAEVIMDRDKLGKLMDYFNARPDIFERIKIAVVMILPENIVYPVLASQNYPQFKIQAFSTVPAAEEWLKS